LSEIQMASSLLTPFPALKGSELIGILLLSPFSLLVPTGQGVQLRF